MKQTVATANSPSVSLLGCGWLGTALAPALMQRGFHVRGSTTRSSKLSALSSMGIEPLLFRIEPDLDPAPKNGAPADQSYQPFAAGSPSAAFFESDAFVINVPPETALGPEFHPGEIAIILTRISQSARKPKHLVYVSSTSVYGSNQGFVTETSPALPDAGSGEILLRAESMLTQFARAHSVSLSIVRSGGLIGPGRHPGLFLAGRKNAANGASPVNMIHQLDLVNILGSLIADHVPSPGEVEVYNAVSSQHPARSEFYVWAAQSIGVEPPTFQVATESATKTISSEKIRALTGLELRFDDLYASMGIKHPEQLS